MDTLRVYGTYAKFFSFSSGSMVIKNEAPPVIGCVIAQRPVSPAGA
jgi:hypothetical protein